MTGQFVYDDTTHVVLLIGQDHSAVASWRACAWRSKSQHGLKNVVIKSSFEHQSLGMGETIIFFKQFQQVQFQKYNSYK
jgi:hypothetical protein